MAATAIMWVAGVAMLVVASSGTCFDRVLGAAVRSQYGFAQRLRQQSYSVDDMLRWSRWVLLGLGCLSVVLAVLGTWVLAG